MADNMVRVSNFLAHTKDEVMNLITMFTTQEQILKNPESAYAVGKLLQLFNDFKDVCEELTKEADLTHNMVYETNELMKEMNETINDLRNEILELKAH